MVRYHWRSLPAGRRHLSRRLSQVYHDVPDLRVVCSGPPGRSWRLHPGLRIRRSRRFYRCVFVDYVFD